MTSFIADEDQDIYYHHRKAIQGSNTKQVCELQIKSHDGSHLPVQLISMVSPVLDGTTGGFRACLLDLSERSKIRKQLSESRDKWESSFDAIADLVTIQDADRNILRANRSTCDFLEKPAEQIIGQKCYEVFCGLSAPCENCKDLAPAAGMVSQSSIVCNKVTGKIFSITRSAIIDEDHQDCIVHVAKDITEEKRIELLHHQAMKMESLGVLAGGIAHDFNNILSAVIGFSELAKEEFEQGNSPVSDIDEVISSGHRAVKLVNQIQAFRSKANQELKCFQPHLVVIEAIKMLRAAIPSSIGIRKDIDPRCGMILAEPASIQQIVLNLCTNAAQSMETAKGTISIGLQREETIPSNRNGLSLAVGPYIVLRVSDTGEGIDEKVIDRIFEPYFTTKNTGNGSGMGLAITHGLVKDFNGSIEVESILGKGTNFTVYLPLKKESPPIIGESDTSTVPLEGSETILVVDDESPIVSLLSKIFQRYGYTVVACTDSLEALKKFKAEPQLFDIVITDQTMPSLSGIGLAERLLEIRPQLPIILCSGFNTLLPERDILAKGIKKYLSKPVDKITLATFVRQLLDEQTTLSY